MSGTCARTLFRAQATVSSVVGKCVGTVRRGRFLICAEQIAKRALRGVRAVLHPLRPVDHGLPHGWVDTLARLRQPHDLHGPDFGRDGHLVNEHVHAPGLPRPRVDGVRLVDAVVLGLGVARVDHRQAVPLDLEADGAAAGVDHREVGDPETRFAVVVGDASDDVVWQLDGNNGVAVIEGILVVRLPVSALPRRARVHDRNGKLPQSPERPDLLGGVIAIRGGLHARALEAEPLRLPPQHRTEHLAEGPRPVVEVAAQLGGIAVGVGAIGVLPVESRGRRAKDEQRHLAVCLRPGLVDVAQVAHVVAVQVGDEDLVHLPPADAHGVVVRAHAGAAVEDRLVRLPSGRCPPAQRCSSSPAPGSSAGPSTP